jgi:hypothetical protein
LDRRPASAFGSLFCLKSLDEPGERCFSFQVGVSHDFASKLAGKADDNDGAEFNEHAIAGDGGNDWRI